MKNKLQTVRTRIRAWLSGHKLLTVIAAVVLALSVTQCTLTEPLPSESSSASASSASSNSSSLTSSAVSSASSEAASSAVADVTAIPAYSGKPYVVINNNIPSFSSAELTTVGYERYRALDSYGRCSVALASCGKEIMPKEDEERGSISNVYPSGWKQAKYDGISGSYLYNRCHLIGWQLSAENANRKNLITGTRYLNTEGMLPFENMVADYIRETGNHVAYRITPVFEGNNLLASGVQMEAYSVEDDGEGICFNVYCYNVQPGIKIDYSTGASSKDGALPSSSKAASSTAASSKVASSKAVSSVAVSSKAASFVAVSSAAPAGPMVYRTPSGKRYHLDGECGGKNSYQVTMQAATSVGLTPCQKCAA